MLTKSFKCIRTYDVPLSVARYLQQNVWNLNHPKDRKCFKAYFLLYWSKEHFEYKFQEGTITYDRKKWQVIYHRTNAQEVIKHEGQLALSFRELEPDFGQEPVVLVSLANVKTFVSKETSNGTD